MQQKADGCKGEDKRVKDVFVKYDQDKDGILHLADFLEFYRSACNNRSPVVWANLASHHYTNDLREYSEISKF